MKKLLDVYKRQAQVSVKRTGGGVNGVIEFEATMILQGAPTVTDPVV